MSLGFKLTVFAGFNQGNLRDQSTQTVGDEDEGPRRSIPTVLDQCTEQIPAVVAHRLLAHRTATEPAADIRIIAVCENSRTGKCSRNQVTGPKDAVCWGGRYGVVFIQPCGLLWMCREDARDFGRRMLDVAGVRLEALPQWKVSFRGAIKCPSSFGMTGEAVDKEDTAATATISEAQSMVGWLGGGQSGDWGQLSGAQTQQWGSQLRTRW
jgi:hypothetical protein